MPHYYVTWDINVDADSPREAAEVAQATQRDPETMATVFRVLDETGKMITVDLEEMDGSYETNEDAVEVLKEKEEVK